MAYSLFTYPSQRPVRGFVPYLYSETTEEEHTSSVSASHACHGSPGWTVTQTTAFGSQERAALALEAWKFDMIIYLELESSS